MKNTDDIIKIIHSLVPRDRNVKIMNVCGSHEHTISFSGMRSLMPENLELIPGPGCPVCVCPESDIVNAINLSNMQDVVLVTYGDMVRVPSQKGSIRSNGSDFRIITSPSEAIRIARQEKDKKFVFFSIGFETTTAPTAAILEMGIPDNLFILSSHKLTPTIMEVLVKDTDIGIDGFVCPGHVSAIVGSNAWNVFSEKYNIPTVVAGFEADSLLLGIMEILSQLKQGTIKTTNVYTGVVKPEGNRQAQKLLEKYFEVSDVNWRGIGNIPCSGLELKEDYSEKNARAVFDLKEIREGKNPGCICGDVVLGKAYPSDCKLFKKSCSPHAPHGPCMVSGEGSCHIWFKSQMHN